MELKYQAKSGLIFYSNHDLAPWKKDWLLTQLGSAAACFSKPEFLSANLSVKQDGYPWGVRASCVGVFTCEH